MSKNQAEHTHEKYRLPAVLTYPRQEPVFLTILFFTAEVPFRLLT